MKTHHIMLLIILIGTGSLWGAEYTATPASFFDVQRNAQSGDTILMAAGTYHGVWEWFDDGITWGWVWTPVIDPNGRNIVYKKDPNLSGEVILSGLVPKLDPPVPPGHINFFRPPCDITNGEGNGCQLIGLTIRCGLALGELPRNPQGFFEDFCDDYGWMGIECWNSSPLIKDCNLVDFPEYPAMFRYGKIFIYNTNGSLVIQSCRFIDINDGGISMTGNVDVQINSCTLSCINTAYCGIYAYPYSGGIAEINNCAIFNFGGGGISIGLTETTISDCNIINNHGSNGGGITCSGNSVFVRRCNLIGNTADATGGGIYTLSPSIIIEDCNIIGNTAGSAGGGIYSDSYNLALRRCRIENNKTIYDASSGGGIGGYGYVDANYCIIRENEAVGYGGGIIAYYDGNLVNCVISKNRSGAGGGGICMLYDSYLYNCTISENETNGLGGGAYFGDGPINATNCIFWGNADIENTPGYQRYHQIYSSYPDSVNLRNCDIQNTSVIGNYVFDDDIVYPDPNTIGKNIGNNIDANPLFADDYHLSVGSPCINAGYNNVVYWAYDIDGEQRINDGVVDIGADEFAISPPPPPSQLLYPTYDPDCNLPIYWSTAEGATSYELDRSNNGGSTWTNVYIGTATFKVETVEPGLYRYRVRGINSGVPGDYLTDPNDCNAILSTCYRDGNTADPNWSQWRNLGRPDCWCKFKPTGQGPRGSGYQCDGDADQLASSPPDSYRVFNNDLALLQANWKKTREQITADPNWTGTTFKVSPACADFDHKASSPPDSFRVFNNDLAIFSNNWKKKNSSWTGTDKLPGNCPR